MVFKNLYFKLDFSIDSILVVLILSVPLLLISGPLLSDLSISLITILFLYKSYKLKLYQYYKSKFFIIFSLFYIYILLNSIFNNFNIQSFKVSLFYFRFGIFALAVWYIINLNKNILRIFFWVFIFCFLILIVDGFYQYINGENLFGYKIDRSNRVSSFFGSELVLGSYISRLFPILFSLTILILNKKNIYLTSIIFILAEVLIFISGERTSFVILLISALYCSICLKRFKLFRITIILFSLALIFIITKFNITAKERMIDQTLQQMQIDTFLSNNKKINETNERRKIIVFSEQHTHHYISALRMFKENIMFGVGVRNFRNYCDQLKYKVSEKSCSTHPHNFYIQLLSETGLIGFFYMFFFLVVFLFFSLRHLLFSFKKIYIFSDFEISIMSAILITLWPIAPSGNFFNNWLSIVIYLPIGMLLWSLNNKNIKKL